MDLDQTEPKCEFLRYLNSDPIKLDHCRFFLIEWEVEKYVRLVKSISEIFVVSPSLISLI